MAVTVFPLLRRLPGIFRILAPAAFLILVCSTGSLTEASAATAKKATSAVKKSTAKKTTAKKKTSTAKKSTTRKRTTVSRSRKSTRRSRTASARFRGQTHPTPDRYREIQTALQNAGFLDGEPTGKWDEPTVSALKRFQEEHEITPNGKINALSLIALGLGPKRGPAPGAESVLESKDPTETENRE